MIFKDGSKLNGVKPEMVLALMVADKIWSNHGQELVVTEVTGGKHSVGSLHYIGHGSDLRTRYFTPEEKELVAKDLREALTDEYDVVVEDTHIHLEFQPK